MADMNKQAQGLLHLLKAGTEASCKDPGWLFGKKLALRIRQLRPGDFVLVDYPRTNKRNIKYYLRKRHGLDVRAYYGDGNKVLISVLRGAEKEG